MTAGAGRHLLLQRAFKPNRPAGPLGKDCCVKLIELLVRVIEALAPEPSSHVLAVDWVLLFLATQPFGKRGPGREDALLAIPEIEVVTFPHRRTDMRLNR